MFTALPMGRMLNKTAKNAIKNNEKIGGLDDER